MVFPMVCNKKHSNFNIEYFLVAILFWLISHFNYAKNFFNGNNKKSYYFHDSHYTYQ